MYFFLNNKLVAVNSGVEHAQARRLKLFKKNKQKAKILTYFFALHTHDYLKYLGLESDDIINFFDFFGNSQHIPPKTVVLEDLPIPKTYKPIKKGTARYDIFQEDQLKMAVFPDPLENEKIGSMWFYDKNKRPIRKIYFDSREFLAAALRFDFEGRKTVQECFSPTGKCYAEIYYQRDKENKELLRCIRLIDYKGADYLFDDWNTALTFFYDEVNQTYKDAHSQNVFISDRSNLTNFPMTQMKTQAVKIEQFHSKHYRDWKNPDSSIGGYPSIQNESRLSHTTAIVVPTKAQRKDLMKRLSLDVPVFSIPVGYVLREQLDKEKQIFANREKGSLIAVARPAYQKQLEDMIQAVGNAHTRFSFLHLDIYGTPAGVEGTGELEKLKAMVKEQNWESFIRFHGYIQDLEPVYEKAELCLFTSRWEGFGLGMLEAMAHGVPLLSYDFNYGANEMINDGKNGFLVPQGDISLLTERLIKCYEEPELLEKFSQEAYKKAETFSEERVWNSWQQVMNKLLPTYHSIW